MDAQQAIGTSLFCMTITTFSATIGYARQKKVDWKLGMAYDIFDIPGIILGAYLTTLLDGRILQIFCGIAVVIIASMVLFKKGVDHIPLSSNDPSCTIDNSPNPSQPNVISIPMEETTQPIDYSAAWKGKNFKWVVISSFLGGLVSGMVGLGGGTVDTTTMILLGVPTCTAVGSSEFAMFLTSLVGASTHAALGNIDWAIAIYIGIGTLVGAQAGSHLAPKVNGIILKKALGGIALFTGIQLLIP